MKSKIMIRGAAGATFLLLVPYCTAQTFTTLYRFRGSPDGAAPMSSLTPGSNGVFYSVTSVGGTMNLGTVYSLTPPATPGGEWTKTVLHNFHGTQDGMDPYGTVVVGANGVLYGTTFLGGPLDLGIVFSLTPPAVPGGQWTETVLHEFTGGADGANPRSPLVFGSDGVLYGGTELGGRCTINTFGCGTVFSLTPPATAGDPWQEAVLLEFNGVTDGLFPTAGVVIGAGGVLYGSTQSAVFSLTPPVFPGAPWTEAVLYDQLDLGCGVTIGPGGVLYGAASRGGRKDDGEIFLLTPPVSGSGPWTFQVLYSFDALHDGYNPLAPVAIDPRNGALFGTAAYSRFSNGTVFGLWPPATPGGPWRHEDLYVLPQNGRDGAIPMDTPTLTNGVLYGTTYGTGISPQFGTVFALTR